MAHKILEWIMFKYVIYWKILSLGFLDAVDVIIWHSLEISTFQSRAFDCDFSLIFRINFANSNDLLELD